MYGDSLNTCIQPRLAERKACLTLFPLFDLVCLQVCHLQHKTQANQWLEQGNADAIAFGVPFIANPDLVKRLATDAALNTPDATTFYGAGPIGYTDYPTLD